MAVVHQQETFYSAIPYNPLIWNTHLIVTDLTTGNLDTSTNTRLFNGETTTFCETNALPSSNEIRLIKFDRQNITPNCPAMKRPFRMWIRNFTAGSLEFYIDGVNLTVNTNSAAETATGGWVDVATGSGTVSSWEVRATTAGADVSIAAVEGGGILHCDTFDRIEFTDDFLTTTEQDLCDSSIHLIANTNTAVFDPQEWESLERAVGSPTPKDHTLAGLQDNAIRGWIYGRRPAVGLQYPRGNYNK